MADNFYLLPRIESNHSSEPNLNRVEDESLSFIMEANTSSEENAPDREIKDLSLDDTESEFLSMIYAKTVHDTNLNWFCRSRGIDKEKTLNKLMGLNYLTISDYVHNVKTSTISLLKTLLKTHHLDAKGKKVELVERTLKNISETHCHNFFQTKYRCTEKAARFLEQKKSLLQAKKLNMIKRGQYDDLCMIFCQGPKRNLRIRESHPVILNFIMNNAFLGWGFPEKLRYDLAAIVALQALYYYPTRFDLCTKLVITSIPQYIFRRNILNIPENLINYIEKKDNIHFIDSTFFPILFNLYIRHTLDRASSYFRLQHFDKIGIKTVRINSCNDSRVCPDCKDRHGKFYDTEKAPLLPLCWECRCTYWPVDAG